MAEPSSSSVIAFRKESQDWKGSGEASGNRSLERRQALDGIPMGQQGQQQQLRDISSEWRMDPVHLENQQDRRSLSLSSYVPFSRRVDESEAFQCEDNSSNMVRRSSWSVTLLESGKTKLENFMGTFAKQFLYDDDDEEDEFLKVQPDLNDDDDETDEEDGRRLVHPDFEDAKDYEETSTEGESSAYQSSFEDEDDAYESSSSDFEDCIEIEIEQETHEPQPEPSISDTGESSSVAKEDEVVVVEQEEQEEENCFICLGAFEECDDSERIILPCSKECNTAPVHAKCIYEWKERRNNANENSGTCPLCRSPLATIDYSPPDLLQIHTFSMFHARKLFITHPIPQDAGTVRCYVRVSSSGWLGLNSYEMWIQGPCALPYPLGVLPGMDSPVQGDQLLLTARKKFGFASNGVINISYDRDGEDFDPNGPNFAGYVQSSFTGLEHTVHNSDGDELSSVGYAQNRFGLGVGPRKMRVVLPQVRPTTEERRNSEGPQPSHETIPNRPQSRRRGDTLASNLQNSREANISNADIQYGENREPSWLECLQAYSLDFHGRVTLPSNKNFQLCLHDRPELKDETVLQFGKVVSYETSPIAVYTLDFKYPMSPLQAFGIVLSSCDRKLLVS